MQNEKLATEIRKGKKRKEEKKKEMIVCNNQLQNLLKM